MAGIRHTASTITDDALDELYASRNSWQRGHETAEAQLVYERRRAAKAEAELVAARSAIDRVRQMASVWEQRFPENIRTAAVVDAIRHTFDTSA